MRYKVVYSYLSSAPTLFEGSIIEEIEAQIKKFAFHQEGRRPRSLVDKLEIDVMTDQIDVWMHRNGDLTRRRFMTLMAED